MRSVEQTLLNKALNTAVDSLFSGVLGGLLGPKGVVGALGPGHAVPTFADGGIMTSAGRIPLRTYAGGVVANSPQAAIFGEGSTPEAYVHVPSGRIPVEMRGHQQQGGLNVKVINNVAGAQPEVQRMSDGEPLVVFNKLVDHKMKTQVPSILANSQRRSQ